MVKRVVTGFFGLLIVIGVVRGLIRYNDASNGGVGTMITSFVDGVADVTYRWFPKLVDLVGQLFDGAAGS